MKITVGNNFFRINTRLPKCFLFLFFRNIFLAMKLFLCRFLLVCMSLSNRFFTATLKFPPSLFHFQLFLNLLYSIFHEAYKTRVKWIEPFELSCTHKHTENDSMLPKNKNGGKNGRKKKKGRGDKKKRERAAIKGKSSLVRRTCFSPRNAKL